MESNMLLTAAITVLALLLTALLIYRRKQQSELASRSAANGAASVEGASKRAPADRCPNGPLLILWGSQTGTAEGFGQTLMREARQRGYNARSLDLEDYDPADLPQAASSQMPEQACRPE